jgi:hypothetical protein
MTCPSPYNTPRQTRLGVLTNPLGLKRDTALLNA